jgi:hypoxanthine phosphoribosyltransferase
MVTKLFDGRQIERRVSEIASEVAKSISGEFTVVGILKGSFVFVADLVRALDHVGLAPRVEFIRLSSYGASREPSSLSLVGPAPVGMLGEVLLVDDITDTGRSLQYAMNLLEPQALAIRTCTLIDKPSRREVEITPDFVGFTVEDVFVVGYGIDHAEKHRHLPWIGTID